MSQPRETETALLQILGNPEEFAKAVDADPDYNQGEKYILKVDSETLRRFVEILGLSQESASLSQEELTEIVDLLFMPGGWETAHNLMVQKINDHTAHT